jgi:hypothetical protein
VAPSSKKSKADELLKKKRPKKPKLEKKKSALAVRNENKLKLKEVVVAEIKCQMKRNDPRFEKSYDHVYRMAMMHFTGTEEEDMFEKDLINVDVMKRTVHHLSLLFFTK